MRKISLVKLRIIMSSFTREGRKRYLWLKIKRELEINKSVFVSVNLSMKRNELLILLITLTD